MGEQISFIAERIPNSRTIMFVGGVVPESAAKIILELLTLDNESNEDITLYINSPGGSVSDGLAIYDTMNLIKSDVKTVCIGMAASMGAFLLSSGAKGKRYALPHSKILIHQPLGGTGMNQQTNVQIIADELKKDRITIEDILVKNTGQELKRIHNDCERDKYLTATEALEYGLIDKIITNQE